MSALPARALILCLAALAGCRTAPEPRAPQVTPPPAAVPAVHGVAEGEWDGSGGAAAMANRGKALANFALTLRGTRYRYGGATLEGFDCSGLVFYAHRRLGLTVPRTSREQAEEAQAVKPRKLKPGDLVFFKIDSRRVNHVGVYVGKKRFVHAPGEGKPVTVNSLEDEFYAETFDSAGRFWERQPR